MKKNIIVKFRDEDHSYWRGSKQLTSVNKVLALFGFDFDTDYFSVRKAMSNNIENFWKIYFAKGFNFEDRVPNLVDLLDHFESIMEERGYELSEEVVKVLDEWEAAAQRGTDFHNKEEDLAYENGFIINPYDGKEYIIREKPEVPKGFDNASNLNFLKDLKDGAYAELVLFSAEHLVSGQSDETFIETIDGVRYVDIGDHKTNSKRPNPKQSNGKCHFPIDHLDDSTYTKYWLQVSMYAHLLERLGYVVRNVGFYHYKDYDRNKRKVFNLKYLGKECADILSYYLENNTN